MKSKQLLSLCISLSILASPAFASEEQEETPQITAPLEQLQEGEHISVGSEPLSKELKEQMDNERVEKYQEFKEKSYTSKPASTTPTLCSLGASAPTHLTAY